MEKIDAKEYKKYVSWGIKYQEEHGGHFPSIHDFRKKGGLMKYAE